MGNNLQAAKKRHVQELVLLVKQIGEKITWDEVKEVVGEIEKSCSWYPAEGSLRVDHWMRVMKDFQAEPRASIPLIITCHKILLALSQVCPADNILLGGAYPAMAQPPPYVMVPPTPCVPLPAAAAPVMPSAPPAAPPLLSSVARGLQAAWHSGQYNPSEEWGGGESSLCCPLIREDVLRDDGTPQLDPQGNPILRLTWKALPYAILREVNKSAREEGIQSPFCQGLLEGISNAHLMLPQDWKDLFRMLLSPSQYTVWDQEFRLAAQARATPDAIAEQIYGSGQFSNLQAQIHLQDHHIQATWQCVQRAAKRTPEKGKVLKSFATIRQNATEPYATFVDRLQSALQRQINNPEAAAELLMKLAFENANGDCKKALLSIIRNESAELADYLKACQDVGTKTHDMALLAQALADTRGNCYNCKKPGHFKADCRAPGGGAHTGGGAPRREGAHRGRKNDRNATRPSTPCPRCNTGFHWGSQCRTNPKTHADNRGSGN